MGYGQFVGRVGLLAVALGVGLAAPAIATADTDTGSAGGVKGSSASEGPTGAGAASSGAAHRATAGPASKKGHDPAANPTRSPKNATERATKAAVTSSIDSSARTDEVASSSEASSTQVSSGTGRISTPAAPSAASVVAAPVTESATLVAQAPARVTAAIPLAVLSALGVLPTSPAAPLGGPLTNLLLEAYRRNASAGPTVQAASVVVTPKAAPLAAAVASGASAKFTVADNWGQGFVGNVNVAAGQTALNGWTVEFDSPATITNIWNGKIVSYAANHYVVQNEAWNGQVAAGQSTAFGFQATPGGSQAVATNFVVNGTPVSQPTLPSVSIGDASIAEGNSGTSNLNFAVSLSKPSTTAVTVAYATSNGTATAGQDYTAKSGTITFAAGETSKTVVVAVTGDTAVEPSESFTVTLSSPSGATIADGSATGTITNDDVAQAPSSPAVKYTVTDDWKSGFTGNVDLTAGQTPLNGWTVEFDTPAQITNVWNGKIVSHTANHYVIQNETWNGQVAAGQTTSFGFQATPGSAQAPVTNFVVNGAAASQLPTLSVADASVAEGNSGTKSLGFTVTLSKPATSPVTVTYTTANGSATAGQDYTATSGTITFAAGETSKTVAVTVAGDTTAETDETLTLTLAKPTGATIADGSATGTITNDDAAPIPGLSISDASATEGNPSTGGIAPGPLHTKGNQILDSTGKPVQLSGVNWFGAEGTNGVPDGLWTRSYKDMIDQMSAQGFNTIRIPYSSDMLHNTALPSGIDYSKNPDLQGLSRIQVLDKIVDYAGQKGMRIILDHHRSTAGAGTSENGLWYNDKYSEDQWVADWQALAVRYKNNPTVIGFDLHNEPYNGTWGGGGANDWARAAERAGNAALAVNPNLLMFVEGVGTYKGQSYWWGGNLMGVKDRPIVFNVPNQLVYSPHDYPNSVYAQPWFQGANFGAGLPTVFKNAWGYIYQDNIAPIYIGEFGTKLQDPKDAVWFEAITSYLSGDFDNNGTIDIPANTEDMSWTYWSWNPNSGDTGGILADDWKSINENKMAYLKPIEFKTGTGGTSLATFTVTLAQPTIVPVTVNYATTNGTATAGSDYVSTAGSITFAPGETSKTITIVVLGDKAVEGTEKFGILLSNPVGATIVDGSGTGTIIDDDNAA